MADYKFGNLTFDDVLNMLMDRVSIEDISAEHIREHYHRLAEFKGIPKEEFKSRMKPGFIILQLPTPNFT